MLSNSDLISNYGLNYCLSKVNENSYIIDMLTRLTLSDNICITYIV